MFALCWCDWPNGLSANHHLSSVASRLFSFSCCCCLHTHMLSFHHNLSLSALLFNFTLIFSSPGLATNSFFYLQELFDLLTDFLYLYDLVMAFQQHVWEYIGRTRMGFSFSIIGLWKKIKALSAGLSPEKYNSSHNFLRPLKYKNIQPMFSQ